MKPRLEIWRGRKIDTSWAKDYLKTNHESEKPRLIYFEAKESVRTAAKQPPTNTMVTGSNKAPPKRQI